MRGLWGLGGHLEFKLILHLWRKASPGPLTDSQSPPPFQHQPLNGWRFRNVMYPEPSCSPRQEDFRTQGQKNHLVAQVFPSISPKNQGSLPCGTHTGEAPMFSGNLPIPSSWAEPAPAAALSYLSTVTASSTSVSNQRVRIRALLGSS